MHLSYRGFCHKNVLSVISQYLNPEDIPNFSKAWRIRWTDLEPTYYYVIKTKIDQWFRNYFGSRYNSFRQAMIYSKAVISGSFILQQALGVSWENADIDIFMGKPTLSKQQYPTGYSKWYDGIELFLYSTTGLVHYGNNPPTRYMVEWDADQLFDVCDYFICDDRATSTENQITFEYNNYDNEEHDKWYELIENVRNPYRKTPPGFTKFQVISLRRDPGVISTLDFIDGAFDFDICKNGFYYDEAGCHIVLHKPNDVIHRQTDFKTTRSPKKSYERYQKYKARGISFRQESNIPPEKALKWKVKISRQIETK